MAGRSNIELKVFLEGALAQYNALTDTEKAGSVFFDKEKHAVYANGECIIQSNIKDVTYNETSTELTITPFTGSKITINLGIQKELDDLEDTLRDWASETFVSTSTFTTELEKKVNKESGSRLMTDAEGTKLADIEPNAQKNKYNTIEAGEDETLLTTIPVDNVKLMGNLMSSSEADIQAGMVAYNFSASYDNTKHKIYFFNTAEAPTTGDIDRLSIAEIDATQFIKDGVVDDVTYNSVTKILLISFNTSSGKTDVPLDLAGLVDTYTAGNGLTVTNNEFSAKLGDGLEFNTYKNITVKYNPNGGITVNAAGVALKAATNGGITVGASGAAVDWTKAPLRTVNGETIADGDVDTTPKVWKFED